ncbi:hypothetical protein CR513_16683, partial [Mucuna pruriens]
MTRSSSEPLHAFDPEIERTLHRLRKARRTITLDSSSSNSIWNSENSNFTTDESISFEHQEARSMENNDRTLKELATPNMVYQPWCIQCPPLEPAQSYKLKSSLIHLLPEFHGLAGEDPHKHLKEFHVVCSTMRLVPILPGWSCKRLAVSTADSLQYLGGYKAHVPREILPSVQNIDHKEGDFGIRQYSGETLHEYWERFNKLCVTCPHHQINEQLLIQYFYEGLMMMDRSMIDAANGGALMDKMPAAARHLISNMANNMQQFETRGTIAPRMVNEISTIDNPRLENQLTEQTSLVRQLAIDQHQPIIAVKACGICTSVEHRTNITGSSRMQPSYLKANNTDNHHTKGRMQLKDLVQIEACHRVKVATNSRIRDTRCPRSNSNSKKHHQTISSSNLQFQKNMNATIQDLKTQVGQLANSISQLQSAGSGNLHSQIIPNSRGNASIVSLRSGKELQAASQSTSNKSKSDANSQPSWQASFAPVPFPSRTLSARKPESDEELLKMFRKVEINIPLLDSIKQIPKYAKFLKELCVHKRKKMKGGVELGGIVSALTRNDDLTAGTRQALPKKCRDPGIFSVPCTIGDCTFADAMLDLELQ